MKENVLALIDERMHNRVGESLTDFVHRTELHHHNLATQARWVHAQRQELAVLLTDETTLHDLTDHSIQQVKDFVYSRNQYLDLDRTARQELRREYGAFYHAIGVALGQMASFEAFNTWLEIETVAHLTRLSLGLDRAAARFSGTAVQREAFFQTVVCGEYSPCRQLDILCLSPDLSGPLLDVGCGSQAQLSCYLYERGVQVLGIDRNAPNLPCCQRADWLEFDYGLSAWQIILSHQSFSTHFHFQHRFAHERAAGMAKAFMRMLRALRPGGRLVYTPGLPFIEPFVEQLDGYHVQRFDIPGTPAELTDVAYACHIQRLETPLTPG